MQLPRILSPVFGYLLTLAVQHVTGLTVSRGEAPTVCPADCLEILPSASAPEQFTSWFQSECRYLPAEEQPACIDDLFVSFKQQREEEGEGSEIVFCCCKNKGQLYRRQDTGGIWGAVGRFAQTVNGVVVPTRPT